MQEWYLEGMILVQSSATVGASYPRDGCIPGTWYLVCASTVLGYVRIVTIFCGRRITRKVSALLRVRRGSCCGCLSTSVGNLKQARLI